jgi:hypothetical protein
MWYFRAVKLVYIANRHARAVLAAIIRASKSFASWTFVAVETLASTARAVAQATV